MKEVKTETKNLSLSNLGDMQVLADDIKRFIQTNRLSTNVQGKEFPQAEAWQYALNRLNIIPQVGKVKNLSTDEELKYQASVLLIDILTGKQVGKGFAVCSNKEQGKKYYQEFAICSMAQTRAIGKAARVSLSFLMKLAGYEPTPAEEMDYDTNKPEPNKAPQATKAPAAKADTKTQEKAPQEPQQEPTRYASAKQKEEIIRLLNNPLITREEKTKMLLNINRFDEERASQSIAKLKTVISAREEGMEVS